MADQVIIRGGEFMRRDQLSGKFVPASEQELDVIQQGPIGTARAFAEGFLPLQGILEQFGVLEEGGAAALGTVAPAATTAGRGTGAAAAVAGGAQLMRAGLGMVRSISGGVSRSTQTTGRIKIIADQAEDAPIRVPVDVGEFVPGGTPPGVVGGVTGGLGGIAQGAVEQSKILSRVFAGTRFESPNVGRQVAAQLAGVRGTALRPADFTRAGKLPRRKLQDAKEATDEVFESALPAEFADDIVVMPTLRQTNLLKAIKKTPPAEKELIKSVLSEQEVAQGVMTNKQLIQRHKDLRGIAAKTDNQLTRDAINEITAELEILMEESTGINVAILRAGKEQWRFDQILINSLGKNGQLNFDTMISNANRMFAKEFKRGDFSELSVQGQDAIETMIAIADAGGVTLPSKAVSAVDWILVLSTMSAAAGGGLVTAGVF